MELKEILSKCDHTLLAQTATWEEIRTLCDDGIRYGCASVCIPASYVRQAAEYVISDAWRSQGYRIQRLDLPHRKVVFHREIHGTVGLTIPPMLLRGRIPENAAHEATTFFAYLIKKDGL